MKILYVSHFVPYPPHGGAIQRNFNLIKEASRQHEVHLITFTQKTLKPNPSDLKNSIESLREFVRDIMVYPVPTDASRAKWYLLLLLNLFALTPYSVWRFRSRNFATAIKEKMRKEKFDLVHIDTIALADYVKYASNAKLILNHHNIESTLMLRRSRRERNLLVKLYLYLQGSKLRRYEKLMASKFTVNVAVSDLDKAELLTIAPRIRVEVVENGTDTDYFAPQNIPQTTSLIFAGGMTWYPNRDAMIWFVQEIYPLIKKQVTEVEMILIGRVPPQEVLDSASSDPSIRVMGYVDDVRNHLARAAVYVVPIRVGGGTRLKILDAMSAGKAIVSTSVGCEGITVTDRENIYVADDPSDFANKVCALLRDANTRDYLGKNARRFVEENYSWKVIGTHQEEIYRSLKT
jgi:sugar transferase (PEP-CTERM/EpsH1 system associated)